MTGAARTVLTLPEWRDETGSSLVSEVPDQSMDASDPIPPHPSSKNLDQTTHLAEETDFGPWLLVSRRRCGAHDRGGSTHASHVINSYAADPSPGSSLARGAVSHSIRGGKSSASGGRLASSHATQVLLYSGLPISPICLLVHPLPSHLPMF